MTPPSLGVAEEHEADGTLHLKPNRQLSPAEYGAIKNAGFRWKHSKGAWVAATTPARRALLLNYATDVVRIPPPPFTSRGQCASCLSPEGTLYVYPTGQHEQLCPACAQKRALWDAAEAQLHEQIEPIARAWVRTWGSVPGLLSLSDMLTYLGLTLEAQIQEEWEIQTLITSAQEGVRPFPVNKVA